MSCVPFFCKILVYCLMKAIELALKAGRKRQSTLTGFVHYCSEHPEKSSETIPTYENFCFALALLRSRIAENVLEAKALLEKLAGIPSRSRVSCLSPRISSLPLCRPQIQTLSHPLFYPAGFSFVLGEKLREQLQAIQGSSEEVSSPESPEDWAEFLIHSQITGQDKTPALATLG